jgi:hypothetical protein
MVEALLFRLRTLRGSDGTRTRGLCRDGAARKGFTISYKNAGAAKRSACDRRLRVELADVSRLVDGAGLSVVVKPPFREPAWLFPQSASGEYVVIEIGDALRYGLMCVAVGIEWTP